MEAGFTIKLENPKETSNILSKLCYGWMIKFCYKGTTKDLDILDLYKTLKCDQSEPLTDLLEQHWNNEVLKSKAIKNYKPSLLKALVKAFLWKYMFYGLLLFIQLIGLRSVQPLILAYFITQFSGEGENLNQTNMYIYGSILIVQSLFIVFLTHHIEFGQSAIGMRIRISTSSLIYRKLLKLSKKSLGQTAAGQVVNLLSNDVSRFDMVFVALHYVWIMPFQVVLVTYLLWREVGISSLAGVISMALLTLPVQGYLGKVTSRLRMKIALRTDHRVKLMNEVISGIQVIKMYAWEKPFEELIKYARKKEINTLTSQSYLRGVFISGMVYTDRAALFITIVCFVMLGNVIRADIVFSMAQFFNILQLAMAILYPMAIAFGAESLVSVERLQDFLMLEEKQESAIETFDSISSDISINNVNASWTLSAPPTLVNFNLYVPHGSLCAIVGPVGGGKSSILQLLLGELVPDSGTITIGGSISYSSQEPWLFSSSVRKNILFGLEYNRLLYKHVVKACALERDFQQFIHGDKTLVGERGASLSGGQRARINLARAVYRSADIYLLDDPLSAVDTHVGKHLFDECILGYLKGKTRVLVTHQLQYLKRADLIIVVNEGRIEAQGTFEELTHSKLDFTKLLVNSDETAEKEATVKSQYDRKASILSSISLMSEASEHEISKPANEEELGSSDSSPFKDYVKVSGNFCLILTLIVILLLGQIACSSTDYWITFWTQQEAIRHQPDRSSPQIDLVPLANNTRDFDYSNYRSSWYDFLVDQITVNGQTNEVIKTEIAVYIYTGLILSAIFFTMLRSITYFKMAMIASRNLHNKMFNALLKAPMRFFDTNPSGRILNRFSKDMGTIDELLPRVLMDAIQILLVMSGILVMVTLSNYFMVIGMLLVGVIFIKVRGWYVATAKDVKHLEGTTKSPVFSHLNSSLYGITTIRASNAEGVLKREFDAHQDVHTSAWFTTIATRVCFGLWLDLLSVIFTAAVIYGFILLTQFGNVNGSFVGLAISQSLILTGMLTFGMRQIAEVINQLTCVERVMQYTKIEDEEKIHVDTKPPKRWPLNGLLEFENLSLRYSEADSPVLENLNFQILPGSKVGIVGRTGAGKSSLISALFRLAPIEGNILIDGVDTKEIKLADLRRTISIIPQEPVLFSASLRYNLDPFQEFDDSSLWNALGEVELRDSVTGLDFDVTEGGGNFSFGQRQLLCLARAILRNNRILVLDEATANVDPRTDALIQATIRKKFRECTVLTIAHRLNTIMDSDKVLVMDSGHAVEYDHPHILLQNPNGYFSKMVAQTGPSMTEHLRKISHDLYLSTIKEI